MGGTADHAELLVGPIAHVVDSHLETYLRMTFDIFQIGLEDTESHGVFLGGGVVLAVVSHIRLESDLGGRDLQRAKEKSVDVLEIRRGSY